MHTTMVHCMQPVKKIDPMDLCWIPKGKAVLANLACKISPEQMHCDNLQAVGRVLEDQYF